MPPIAGMFQLFVMSLLYMRFIDALLKDSIGLEEINYSNFPASKISNVYKVDIISKYDCMLLELSAP